MSIKKWLSSGIFLFLSVIIFSQDKSYLLIADRVFDGEAMHSNWVVWVEGNIIKGVGDPAEMKFPKDIDRIELDGTTLLPGLIEGHSHILLHPYNETSWNDQVLKESQAERVTRAVVHAKATLMAGFTTIRDLGSEGVGYADVGIKQSIEKGIIPGPRMIVAGRAIVSTGSYGPKGFAPNVKVPLGAEEADFFSLPGVVRDQIGNGADVVKVYADYRWGLNKEALPTFLAEELRMIVEITASSGRKVAAHASSEEGMLRAIQAGVSTIEHGDGGTKAVFEAMAERGIALCPTLAAGDAVMQYKGWKKGMEEAPERIKNKRKSFKMAIEAGVIICAGGDVGVFTHGDNARELEMMVDYGMHELDVLKSATSVNADVFGYKDKIGRLKAGLFADIIAVKGNPVEEIGALRRVVFVMKDGEVYKNN